jgi:hypothetical protein
MTKTAVRRTLVASVSVTGVILIALIFRMVSNAGGDNIQPIRYNHKVHIESVGLTCADCHKGVETLASATIPVLAVCQECHSDELITESPEEVKLSGFVTEQTEIPWRQIYEVPDHVYFSHRRHVVGGGVECSECHGNVSEFTEPISSAFQLTTMENCMSCHRERKITNDCLSCHR